VGFALISCCLAYVLILPESYQGVNYFSKTFLGKEKADSYEPASSVLIIVVIASKFAFSAFSFFSLEYLSIFLMILSFSSFNAFKFISVPPY